MVKEIIRDISETIGWPAFMVLLTIIGGAVTFAIQIGTAQTHIEINTGRISYLENLVQGIQGKQYQGLAIQEDHARRLNAIEQHDLLTRETEAKIIERLSKLEASR